MPYLKQTFDFIVTHWAGVVDFVIVYLITYRLLLWARNTYVFNLVRGLILILLIYPVSIIFSFSTIEWVLGKLTTVLLLMVIILFQPELRRFLERIGAQGRLFSPLLVEDKGQSVAVIKYLLTAVTRMASEKVGAIIAIESSTNLADYIASGVTVNGVVTDNLLVSLFWPGSPTHDGAAIIRGNRIEAAGCLLPLTDAPLSDRRLGTRHRAAIGLSEVSDAVIIVISEETGVISLVENGNITRFLTREALETRLFSLYKEEPQRRKKPA